MKCCVLEDCNRDLNLIISCIQADDYLNNQLSIKSYTSTSQIDLTTDIFDILLLDIDLPDKNGIDFANDYIKIYPNAKIIFISSHNELVFDSFKVHPYSFIKKENINIELNDTLLELLDLLKLHKKEIVLNNKDHTTIIQQNDIIYIESLKHYCYIHTKCTTEPYKIRANMRQILEDLNFYFYRINRSYIINLNEIKQIKNGRVILKNDMAVSLQRGQIKKFQNTYDNFLCRKIII